MFRAGLINVLNRHVWLQYIIVILPVLMVAIYGFAYLTDMLGVARNLTYNDSVAQRSWGTNSLHEVLEMDVDEDGRNYAILAGSSTDIIEVKDDYTICYVQIYDSNWYQIVTESSGSFTVEYCSLFDVIDEDDGWFILGHDDISAEYLSGDVVCYVSISPDGMWRVTFRDEDKSYYDIEELYMMELVSQDEEKGTDHVRVNSNQPVYTDDVELNFCTTLPTSGIYYDDNSGSFVTNVTKDYPWTFMLRANIGVVIVATAMLCFLLMRMSQEDKLDLLKNRYMVRVNLIALICLVLCVPFTLMML